MHASARMSGSVVRSLWGNIFIRVVCSLGIIVMMVAVVFQAYNLYSHDIPTINSVISHHKLGEGRVRAFPQRLPASGEQIRSRLSHMIPYKVLGILNGVAMIEEADGSTFLTMHAEVLKVPTGRYFIFDTNPRVPRVLHESDINPWKVDYSDTVAGLDIPQ